MHVASMVATVAGGAGMLAWRLREGRSPVTAPRLLLPPVGMATGFCMFLVPQTRVPLLWAVGALLTGAILLSYPLIHTSRLEKRGEEIVMQRSKAFLPILLALLAVRIALRGWIEQYLDVMQTGSLFFLFAFGLLVPWRVAMYLRYRKLRAEQQATAALRPAADFTGRTARG